MKKILLIIGLSVVAPLLGGCVAVYEEHRAVRPPHVIYYGPPCGVVEVVPAPPPYWHGPPRHHRY